jgi:cell division protein FtsI (penicillin-binding protein 3)
MNQLPSIAKRRLRWFWLLICFLAIASITRLGFVQLIDASNLNKISYGKRSITRVVPAVRGRILDNQGKVLAETVYKYDVNAAPDIVSNTKVNIGGKLVEKTVPELATIIATVLKLDPTDVLNKISGTSKYSNIAKRVSAAQYRRIKKLGINWVFFDPVQVRVYPNGAVAGNLLGFVGTDGNALAGIERTSDRCLAGSNGEETFERGAIDGIKIPTSTVTTKIAKPGSDVVLTINSDLQYYAQQVMAQYVKAERADWGSAVIIEVKTGKILAAAEAPSVDPNAPGKSLAPDRMARIFQAVFEPGSTLKTVTAATAIDVGIANPSTQVVAVQKLKVLGRYWIQDSHVHPPQHLTLTGVLRDSSNTGMVQVGIKVPKTVRYQYLKNFGLGEKTAVNFEGESGGILHTPNLWDGLTNYTSQFGQGLAVTPIQTAMLYETIANMGVRLAPQLVAGCRNANGALQAVKLPDPVRVLKTSSARSVIDMLEKVVEQGPIGKTAQVAGYRMAGKSGTAQIKDGKGYGYRYAISFIGMAPADDPKYVLATTIYKPRTVSNSIGVTPPFKAIMEQILRAYRVPPSTTKSANIPTEW